MSHIPKLSGSRSRSERLGGKLTMDAGFTKVFILLNLKLTAESAFIVQCPRLHAGGQSLQLTQKLSLSPGTVGLSSQHPTDPTARLKCEGGDSSIPQSQGCRDRRRRRLVPLFPFAPPLGRKHLRPLPGLLGSGARGFFGDVLGSSGSRDP